MLTMDKIEKKRIIPIKCFEVLDGITATDLQLNIDLSKEAASKCNYLRNASSIIEYTEAYGINIDYRLKYLKPSESYIRLRTVTNSAIDPQQRLEQMISLVSQGATVVFGLSSTTPFNTLYSLMLLSILHRLSDSGDYIDNSLAGKYNSYEYLFYPKPLTTPCLLGYNIINKHDELQWGLCWEPRPSDIEWDSNKNSSKNDDAGHARMFDLTKNDIKHIDNINNNNTLNPNGRLRILKRKKDCFISAFAINYKKGSLIIAPAHCRDDIVELFYSKKDIHFSSTIADKSAANKVTLEIIDWPRKEKNNDTIPHEDLEITVKTTFPQKKTTEHKVRLHHLLKFLIIYQLTEDQALLLYCTKASLEKLNNKKYKCLMISKKGSDGKLDDFDFLDFFIKGGKAPSRGILGLQRICSWVLTGKQDNDGKIEPSVKAYCEDDFFDFHPKGFSKKPYKKYSLINCAIKSADGFTEFCKKVDFKGASTESVVHLLDKLATTLAQQK